jgi:hypothetical protein
MYIICLLLVEKSLLWKKIWNLKKEGISAIGPMHFIANKKTVVGTCKYGHGHWTIYSGNVPGPATHEWRNSRWLRAVQVRLSLWNIKTKIPMLFLLLLKFHWVEIHAGDRTQDFWLRVGIGIYKLYPIKLFSSWTNLLYRHQSKMSPSSSKNIDLYQSL